MSLPDDYLTYPQRRHGSDIDRYRWRTIQDRPVARIDGIDLAVSIIIPLEYFMLNPGGKPFRHPGAMVTPYPDLRHYTTRDYGNRVGVFRLLKVLRDSGVRATFAVNGVLLDRVRPLIEAIIADGHEIAAHGVDTDAIHWSGLDPKDEATLVKKTRSLFENAGLNPRAWMSPARQQSAATPDLIRAAGFDICLDWEMDSVPVAMETAHGPLHALPVSNELDDRTLLLTRRQSEAEWRDQIVEAVRLMIAEAGTRGTQSLAFTTTPYIAGQPFRVWAVRDILTTLSTNATVKMLTASQTIDLFT